MHTFRQVQATVTLLINKKLSSQHQPLILSKRFQNGRAKKRAVVNNYLLICGTRIHHLHKLYTVNQSVWH